MCVYAYAHISVYDYMVPFFYPYSHQQFLRQPNTNIDIGECFSFPIAMILPLSAIGQYSFLIVVLEEELLYRNHALRASYTNTYT